MKKLGCGAAIILLLFFMGLIGALPVIEVPLLLLFGWVLSAGRLLHAWHAAPGHLVLLACAVLLLVSGGHAFLQWLYKSTHPSAEQNQRGCSIWRWKWTLCGLGIVTCALIAIASIVLMIHQLYWMSRSSESWFQNRTSMIILLPHTGRSLLQAAETNRWDSTATRAVFWANADFGTPAGELLQPIWIPAESNTLRAVVLLPRQNLTNRVRRFALIQPGTDVAIRPLASLPEILGRLGIQLPMSTNLAPQALLP